MISNSIYITIGDRNVDNWRCKVIMCRVNDALCTPTSNIAVDNNTGQRSAFVYRALSKPYFPVNKFQ